MIYIRDLFTYYISSFWQWVALLIGLGVTGGCTFLLVRWSWRWFVYICLMLLAFVFLLVLPFRQPAHAFLDESTPAIILNHFWTWIWVLIAGIVLAIMSLIRLLYGSRPAVAEEAAPAEAEGGAEQVPDVNPAWREIQVRMSHARIELGSQNVYLVLAPHEDWTAAFIHSAGLQLFAQAPETDAPIHAFATADGVFLGVAGASGFGTQVEEGVRRLEAVCRLILAERPDCPLVRGVVVLFPITWAGQPESIKWASAVRNDLRAIERVLKIRCPVFAVFPQMETSPGFPEFVGRMSAALRQSRCGFAVPASQPFSGDLVQNGLIWMAGWFHGWILSLMADDLFNQHGNSQLFRLDYEFRRYRKRLRAVLEAAISTHRETEPILFRGCYFTATGGSPREQAFTAGLLRGQRGRIVADHSVTQWTEQARDDDRSYRRLALALGLAGGAGCVLLWLTIVAMTGNRFWLAGPAVMGLVWSVVLFRIARW